MKIIWRQHSRRLALGIGGVCAATVGVGWLVAVGDVLASRGGGIGILTAASLALPAGVLVLASVLIYAAVSADAAHVFGRPQYSRLGSVVRGVLTGVAVFFFLGFFSPPLPFINADATGYHSPLNLVAAVFLIFWRRRLDLRQE